MKNLKLSILSFLLIAFAITSCTNNEPIDDNQQQIDESTSITSAIEELSSRFTEDGTMIVDQNPAGNIIFDFCFDFVYPITLSYNNGTTVTVNSFDDLIEVMINSTNDLYVNGIAFPFDVETYDDDTDGIVIQTINNEEEFIDLLESCDFDDIDSCDCSDEFDPVCVEVDDPSGNSFLITYPNACWAECDGFTEEDFAEECDDDYNCPGGTPCFDFNFPLTIITDNGETVTVNSQEELDTVLYDNYYFDFVYPFSVTLDDDEGTVVTIENEEDFYELLEECYDDGDDFDDCECTEEFDPVCVEYDTGSGNVEVIVFPNACYAECEGFTSDDFVDCDFVEDCTPNDIFDLLISCSWFVEIQGTLYVYTFNADGTFTVESANNVVTTGNWNIGSPSGGVNTVILADNQNDFSDIWFFFNCDPNEGIEVYSDANQDAEIEQECE